MKIFLPLLAGMAVVLVFGLTFAQDTMTDTKDPADKIIRDDDLLRDTLDPDRATINQMPAESDAEGSAAGGVRDDSESMRGDDDQSKEPVEKGPAETVPDFKGTGAGGESKDLEGY
jgi:hypothetical protein